MTGEITLRGSVLPVGGIRQKVLAAQRAGIKKMILPLPNKKDLVDIPKKITQEMEFVFVEDIKEVFRHALTAPLGRKPQKTNKGKKKAK